MCQTAAGAALLEGFTLYPRGNALWTCRRGCKQLLLQRKIRIQQITATACTAERSFANHSDQNKLFSMQATSSSVLHQSLCVTPHIAYLLLLTKRSKERRWSCRDAATEPDSPTLPGPGIVSLSVTLVFLCFPTPLVPSAPSSPVSLSVMLFCSSASPGRDAYVVVFLTVNSTHKTTWTYLTP